MIALEMYDQFNNRQKYGFQYKWGNWCILMEAQWMHYLERAIIGAAAMGRSRLFLYRKNQYT
jgi:hypothetical protein